MAKKYAEALIKKLVYGLRKVDVTTVNERVAELKAQALVNTSRHTSTSQD